MSFQISPGGLATFNSTFWWGFLDQEWTDVLSQSAFPLLHLVTSRILYKHIFNTKPLFLRAYILKNAWQCIKPHDINEHFQAVNFNLHNKAFLKVQNFAGIWKLLIRHLETMKDSLCQRQIYRKKRWFRLTFLDQEG